MAFAPANVVADDDPHYVASNYSGPNVAHPNGTWDGHSVCFDYFLHKDNCVHGSIDHPCPTDGTGTGPPSPGYTVHGRTIQQLRSMVQYHEYHPVHRKVAPLVKRYDTTENVDYVAGGNGICGFYNTTTQIGACIWSGDNRTDGTDPATAGWINGRFNSTCGKKLYIQRKGKPETVKYLPVLDGCNFAAQSPADGCFQIYLTEAAFLLFADQDEFNNGYLNSSMSWDFDNLQLDHPWNAPL
ncbi:hypothetical protein CROQUDRAFT_649944 [Cronartium quercuum f. sp. fusiforme G11]|uniref:Uncharacterized protein n=1 Tax=Cronartium quercuum f. sp. fusiforme G11 TaxID=708437 RepID=A0A9P6NZV0_9BASI|nr:hypothetical protein CROQUDRAFT_649944 [Cronartium quercuum f. sp. fusiforme G11]